MSHYKEMVEELCSANCIALELRAQDAVAKLRELVGPIDVELARVVR